MKCTKHFMQRTNERGITKMIVDLALSFGQQKGDKIILNKKETRAVLLELDFLRRNLIKVLDKKGVVVVADDDALITAYGIFA